MIYLAATSVLVGPPHPPRFTSAQPTHRRASGWSPSKRPHQPNAHFFDPLATSPLLKPRFESDDLLKMEDYIQDVLDYIASNPDAKVATVARQFGVPRD